MTGTKILEVILKASGSYWKLELNVCFQRSPISSVFQLDILLWFWDMPKGNSQAVEIVHSKPPQRISSRAPGKRFCKYSNKMYNSVCLRLINANVC